MLIVSFLVENYQIPPNWQYHWHIDGLGDYKDKQKSALFGDINNFTALVGKEDPYDLHVIFHPLGVVLQDAEEDYMGNLTVYPGSHFQLQNYFRIYGFDELYQKGVEGLPQLDFNATRAVQIHARAGDAVILNYSTAHNIAPNISPYIRYTVYFRITCVHQRNAAYAFQPSPTSSMQGSIPLRHRPDAMLSVWSDWKGLQRMPFYSRDDTNGGIVALPRSETHTSVRPQRKESALPTMQNSQTPKSPEEDEEMRQLALAIERSKYEQ